MRSLTAKGAKLSGQQGRGSRYAAIKILGRGAFGTAYLVRRKSDSFLFVMKKLALEQLGQKERMEAMNECAVLTKLRKHPNIVSVLEHFEDDGRLCIVMEYADGGDLAQRIEHQAAAKAPFEENQVLDWFVQVCLALKHAHDRLILHRDLKPQNIFLTRKNFVRLGDFGISRVLTNTQSVASTCVGTPLYLAPELCEGKEYKEKGDVWSLGAILYELCVLQPPFTANTMPALVMRICNDDPRPVKGEFCDETKALALKLLRKDPDARPRVHDVLTMEFIMSRIEQFLDPDAIIDEFSHTVIREPTASEADAPSTPASSQRPAVSAKGGVASTAARSKLTSAGSAPVVAKTRAKAGAGAATGGGAGMTKRAPSRGGAGAGATTVARAAGGRRPSPGPQEAVQEETSAQRAQRLKEDEDRRLEQREQMRRDRLAYAKSRGKTEPSAAEIVEKAVAQQGEHALPAVAAISAPQLAELTEVDDTVRRALEAAFPGTRLLTQGERRVSHDSLLKRQEEVVARVQSSQLKGEAGRLALNGAQRELLDISRIRAATSKRYVLLRIAGMGSFAPLPPGTTIAGVPLEEIGHIDEDDAEVDDTEDDDGEGEGDDADASDMDSIDGELMATMRLGGHGDQSSSGSRASAETAAHASTASTVTDAERRHGGIKFDVTLESQPKSVKRTTRPAEHTAAPAAPTPVADISVEASTTLNVPAQLFGVGRPLSSKVERLRGHLKEKLGSEEAFARVYDYVSREESGSQQSGEREEILSFMADQRDLLPLVHTLLYLEEALNVRH